MKIHTLLLLSLSLATPAFACGPWFPESVLDQPQAALDVPPLSYAAELASIFPKPTRPPETTDSESNTDADALSSDGNEESGTLLAQVPYEIKELKDWWQKQGLPETEIAQRVAAYSALRTTQLTCIESIGFRSLKVTDAHAVANLPERPLANILPPDVADFVEASRLVILGRTPDAVAIWQKLLALPAAEKKFRGAWAAWMLAKTSTTEAEAMRWYARTIEEVAAGAHDCLNLAPAAACWLGPRDPNPVQGLKLLVGAWRDGRDKAMIDLRRVSARLLLSPPETLDTLAADPLAREILTIEAYVQLDGPNQSSWSESPNSIPFPFPTWLAALEKSQLSNFASADRMAWALYACGEYSAARRWLALAQPHTPRALWLKAKLDLRDGKLDLANQALDQAVTNARRAPNWQPENSNIHETPWYETSPRLSANQARLLCDAAIVDLARGEALRALAEFTEAEYTSDAAYVAEYVVTCDELLGHVRRYAPAWSPRQHEYWDGKSADIDAPPVLQANATQAPNGYPLLFAPHPNDTLRYLLARRLTREFRFREAREFMPHPLLPVFDHYVALHRAGMSNRYHGATRAAILWRQAKILREFGMLFIGTEGAPDGFERDGDFTATDFFHLRSHPDGWKTEYQYQEDITTPPSQKEALPPYRLAIPRVTRWEIRRAQNHAVLPPKRFHYRYRAAEIAWSAAALLPDNHSATASILNTAGKWLATRDPEAADRFYQALVRRNPMHPLGQSADNKRWFLNTDTPPDLPELPAELVP